LYYVVSAHSILFLLLSLRRKMKIEIDETALQILLLALQDARDKNIGDIDLRKLLPSLEDRQAFMKLYHQENGDPKVYEEDLKYNCEFLYFNPNDALFILYGAAIKALEAKGVTPFVEQYDKYEL
jgi:hypothetical protein